MGRGARAAISRGLDLDVRESALGAVLLAAKAPRENLAALLVLRAAPTDDFGKGSPAADADVVVVQATVADAW